MASLLRPWTILAGHRATGGTPTGTRLARHPLSRTVGRRVLAHLPARGLRSATALVAAGLASLGGYAWLAHSATASDGGLDAPIVFVSRQIPRNGSIYWDVPNDLPGVGPHSRFRVAAPGKLLVRDPSGAVRALIDGSAPTQASLHLIDVNAPDVAYDGTRIVFAGLPSGRVPLSGDDSTAPAGKAGAWRIYSIRADGTALRQVTFSDQNFTQQQLRAHFPPEPSGYSQAADRFFREGYDDTDPAWLPDGRIVFSSTRWPSTAQYSGVRTTNLYVVNADGTRLHRITSERNGADRPLVDPVTGKIVYSRWWRNHRFPLNDMRAVAAPGGGYVQKDGLSAERGNQVGGGDFLFRNAWHAATINPDGTGLAMWSGAFRGDVENHLYGGAFNARGALVANFFPMFNMTEASGFGGLRLFRRGAGACTPMMGITRLTLDYVHPANPTSSKR